MNKRLKRFRSTAQQQVTTLLPLQRAFFCIDTIQHSYTICIGVSTGKGKALAWAGVPTALTSKLSAGDWVKAALELLGGKGGGKPGQAQGQGPNVEKIGEAVEAAAKFAASKL